MEYKIGESEAEKNDQELQAKVAVHVPVLSQEKMDAIEKLIGPGFIILYRNVVEGKETEQTVKNTPTEMGLNHVSPPTFAMMAGAFISRLEASFAPEDFRQILLHSRDIRGAEKKL